MKVDLHIEELVLHGFPAHDRQRIGEAVRGELARLLAERGLPSSLGHGTHVARLDGGTIKLGPDVPADGIGAQVARAVERGWRR